MIKLNTKFILPFLIFLALIGFILDRSNLYVAALTFISNSAATFNGSFGRSSFNSAQNGMIVTPSNSDGIYDSAILNGGSAYATWNSVNWTQPQLYNAELPSSGGTDSGFTNNFSMTNNQAYYKFNETGTPTTWADSSGNANNITQNGGVAPPSDSSNRIFNRAWSSTGATAQTTYSILPAGVTAAGQSKYTIMFWMRPTGTLSTSSTYVLYEESNGLTTAPRISVRISNNNVQFLGRSTDTAMTDSLWVNGSRTVAVNTWYHIAVVYDSTSSTNNLKLYVSGVEESASLSVPAFPSMVNLTTKPRLGQTVYGNTNKFNGQIDEFATFTRALSAAEIQQVYSRGGWNSPTFQARSCPTTACTGITATGPTGGSSTFVNNDLTSTNTTQLSSTYFPPNQYFRYKISITRRVTSGLDFPTGAISSVFNQITIDYSTVPAPTLSFAIRNSSDNGNTNICSLSVASVSTTNTCSYRLKVTSNIATGYLIFVKTDSGLTNNTYTISDANPGGGFGGSDISGNTVGIEKYGITVDAGTVTSGAYNASTNTFDPASPINSVALNYPTSTAIIESDGINAPAAPDTVNTALITHRLNISGTTPPGNYKQVITYTVTATF